MFVLVIVVLLSTDKDRKGTITLIYQMIYTICYNVHWRGYEIIVLLEINQVYKVLQGLEVGCRSSVVEPDNVI
jgi:hypothetical protein